MAWCLPHAVPDTFNNPMFTETSETFRRACTDIADSVVSRARFPELDRDLTA